MGGAVLFATAKCVLFGRKALLCCDHFDAAEDGKLVGS